MPIDPLQHDDEPVEQHAPRESLHRLTFGRGQPAPVAPRSARILSSSDAFTDFKIVELSERFSRKADAARWAASCQRSLREPGQVADPQGNAPDDPETIALAESLTNCFYWLNSSSGATPSVTLLDDLAASYDALAEVLRLAFQQRHLKGYLERWLPVLAEAQSAVRRALIRLKAPDDPDQLGTYEWVRDSAARHLVFLKHHMRADDQADPSRSDELLTRIKAIGGVDTHSPGLRCWLDRIREQAESIQSAPTDDQTWHTLIETVASAVEDGLLPSDRSLRDLLLPLVARLPDQGQGEIPPPFRLVLREVDQYLASRPQESDRSAVPDEPTAEVKQAASLLRGRSMVLIGGICHTKARASIESALGLKELIWIETKEHQSISSFELAIARPDVAVVLLAIRWSSHAFGDVIHFCDRHGKPLVRLPGGYNVNQVAAQILNQCSDQLSKS